MVIKIKVNKILTHLIIKVVKENWFCMEDIDQIPKKSLPRQSAKQSIKSAMFTLTFFHRGVN